MTPSVSYIEDYPTWGDNWRVHRCHIDQVPDLAYARSGYEPEDGHRLKIVAYGWYRCNPCRCGVHAYDIDAAPPGQRGAFKAWMVGT